MKIFDIILLFLGTYIGTIISIKSIFNLMDEKADNSLKLYLSCFIASILLYINNIYNINMLKMIITFLIMLFLSKYIFNKTFKKVLYYNIVFTILSMFIEIIISLVLFNNIKNLNALNKLIFFKIFITLLYAAIIYFITKNKFIKNIVNKTKGIIKSKFNFYAFTLIIIIILMIIMNIRANMFQQTFYIFYEILCIIFILISISSIIKDKNNISVLNEINNQIKNQNKAYSQTIDECNELKHNLKNDLYAIEASLPNKYRLIIREAINKYNQKYEWINKIEELPEGLQGLIYLKINEAKSKKVKVYLNSKSFSNPDYKDYIDLCDTIGILIDNAIYASQYSKSKSIVININEKSNYLTIQILNNYNNKIDLNKIGKKNYSTKEYKSGLGLNYIKGLNNNIDVKFEIIGDMFKSTIKYGNIKKKSIKLSK